MKFGLFFNPVIPRRSGQRDWDPDQERRSFVEMIEQIRFADSLGIDYVFLGEHHFMPEYAHNSAPEVLLGAIAASTTGIRIGTGIVHASHNDPVRTASASPPSTSSVAAGWSSASAAVPMPRSRRCSSLSSPRAGGSRRGGRPGFCRHPRHPRHLARG